MVLLELPLQSLDTAALQNLRDKYPHAVVRVEADEPSAAAQMTDEQFWQIIRLLDWKKNDDASVTAPAIAALSQYPAEDIAAFDELLAQKLYALDGRRYAEQTGQRAYSDDPKRPFSVDGFLYSRCAVVANGKVFYEKVLQNPALMPQNYTFEPLLYLAEKAYCAKTGREDYDYVPQTSPETFSNPNGWPGRQTLQERLLGR